MESLLMTAIVIGGILLLAGVAWAIDPANHALAALRRAKDTPIAELKHGEWARVTGVVSAAAPTPTLTSPIGDDECIGFRIEVTGPDQTTLSTVIQNTVSTVMRRETCQPFSISDETGKAHVDGPFLLGLDFGAFIAVPEYRHSFLEEAGVPTAGILFDKRLAYREVLLRPGDRISIFGLVFLEPDPTVPAAGLRSPPLVARIQGSDARPIIIVRAR
jgi:hypothetical protein